MSHPQHHSGFCQRDMSLLQGQGQHRVSRRGMHNRRRGATTAGSGTGTSQRLFSSLSLLSPSGALPCSPPRPASQTCWHRASSPAQAACGSAAGRWPAGPWRLCCWGRAAGPSGSQPVPSQSHSPPGGPLRGGKGPSRYCCPVPGPKDTERKQQGDLSPCGLSGRDRVPEAVLRGQAEHTPPAPPQEGVLGHDMVKTKV